MTVILASASPRRHELLKQIVDDFLIIPTNIDEEAFTTDDPIQTAEKLAFEKAAAVKGAFNDPIILGCDTVVSLNGTQYAKPKDGEDAIRILKELRGKTHQVITGVAALTPFSTAVAHCITHVTFNDVSDEEICQYVETGEPMDKAGAYGAQGMGSFLVKSLDGPFDNVVGLPLDLTRGLLQHFGLETRSK